MPAGRSTSSIPSGASAVTTVSSEVTAHPGKGRFASSLDDDRVGDVVVQALARVAEDHQAVDKRVDRAGERDHHDDPADEIAQAQQAAERCPFAVRAHDAHAEQLL